MVRGDYAHSVLERTYQRLREETGDRRDARQPGPGRAHPARGAARASDEFPSRPKQTRVRAAARGSSSTCCAISRREAEPTAVRARAPLELPFGDGEVDRGDRGRPDVRGRIDRVDTIDGMALVLDYKTGRSVDRSRTRAGSGEPLPGRALHARRRSELLGLRGRSAGSTSRSARKAAPAGCWRARSTSSTPASSTTTGWPTARSSRSSDWALRAGPRDRRPRCAAASSAATRTRARGTAAARTRRSAGAR